MWWAIANSERAKSIKLGKVKKVTKIITNDDDNELFYKMCNDNDRCQWVTFRKF